MKLEKIGWIEALKDFKKIAFLYLRNKDGIFQITIKNDVLNSIKDLSRETLIKVNIIQIKNELIAEAINIIKKPISKIYPFELQKFKSKSSRKTKLDYRYFDLRSRTNYLLFKLKSVILQNIRNYLNNQSFIEVHTPKILSTGSEGGAELFKLNYFGSIAYLAQSPQLYKQILINAGFNKIYEISYIYRAEKSDTPRHLCESLCLDVELECNNLNNLIELMKNILIYSTKGLNQLKELHELNIDDVEIKESDFIILNYSEMCNLLKISENSEINHLQEIEILEITGKKFCFIVNWPINLKPFYIKKRNNIAYGLDLISKFAQISSGGLREDEFNILNENLKLYGLEQDHFTDYLESFCYATPEHAGFAIGLDRLICEILKLEDIRDIVLFPRDKHITKP